jgi:hypothetical protein
MGGSQMVRIRQTQDIFVSQDPTKGWANQGVQEYLFGHASHEILSRRLNLANANVVRFTDRHWPTPSNNQVNKTIS